MSKEKKEVLAIDLTNPEHHKQFVQKLMEYKMIAAVNFFKEVLEKDGKKLTLEATDNFCNGYTAGAIDAIRAIAGAQIIPIPVPGENITPPVFDKNMN